MPIGIAAPIPTGIPGFNRAGQYVRAGIGGGAINALPLPGWFNIIRSVINANDSVSLPPATCGGIEIVVWNYSNAIDPILGTPIGVSNTATVFGNVNPQGVVDTIDNGTGTQVATGVNIAAGSVGLFWVMVPQAGFTNSAFPGRWNFKLLA